MKLLFDESLSPRLVSLLRDLFPESESALRNGLAVQAIGEFWNTLRRMVSSWFRLTAILSVCCSSSRAPKSSFCVPAIIQPRSLRTCFAGMRSSIAELPASRGQLIILDR